MDGANFLIDPCIILTLSIHDVIPSEIILDFFLRKNLCASEVYKMILPSVSMISRLNHLQEFNQ